MSAGCGAKNSQYSNFNGTGESDIVLRKSDKYVMSEFIDLIKNEKYNELIDLTTSVLKNDPDDLNAPYYRGKAYYYLNELDKAEKDFDSCLRINDGFALAYTSKTLARMLQFPHTGADEEDMYDDAAKAAKIDPDNPAVHFELGVFLAFVCDAAAMDSYTKAIDLNPVYADAYYNRGLLKSNAGDHEGAVKDYTKAIEIDKTYSKAYHNRATDKGKLHDHKGAMEDYTFCIELEGDACISYFDRATEFAKVHEFDNATADLEHFIKMRSDPYRLKKAKRLIGFYKFIKKFKNKTIINFLMKFV